jgi:hypothetical protein
MKNFDISADIVYPDNPEMDKVIECEEFREMITTCTLAMEINRSAQNTAVRKALKNMLARFKGRRSSLIVRKALGMPLPAAYIQTLHRGLINDKFGDCDEIKN